MEFLLILGLLEKVISCLCYISNYFRADDQDLLSKNNIDKDNKVSETLLLLQNQNIVATIQMYLSRSVK